MHTLAVDHMLHTLFVPSGTLLHAPSCSGLERERRKRCRFFREIRCNVEGDNRTIGRVTGGYRMVSNDYLFVARWGIIIVAVHANRECNPVG